MRVTRLACLGAAAAFGACSFELAPLKGDAGAVDATDAPDVDADADAVVADAPIDGTGGVPVGCPWSHAPAYVDPCGDRPAPPLTDLSLTIDGVYTYDSSGTVLIDPTSGSLPLVTTMVGNARVVWTQSLSIDPLTTLRLVGPNPVIIVSTTSMTIGGTIDASSHWTGTAFSLGAGANPPACSTAPAVAGQQCTHGGSAGGGGGFGQAGGSGGRGGNMGNCGASGNGIPGGAGGGMVAGAPAQLRGGCPGAEGAFGDGVIADRGLGGPGGGAVHLVTRDTLTIASGGIVHAGGGGGRPGTDDRAGAGGGGSGGMVSVAAESVAFTSSVLAANGGGGGGGCNAPGATAGEDGKPAAVVANRGIKEGGGGDGGDGGFATSPAVAGSEGNRGGGGGGGGAGIVLRQSSGESNSNAVFSPPPL